MPHRSHTAHRGEHGVTANSACSRSVYLTFSGVTGENCVVTIRDNPGPRLPMNAYVRLSGTTTWNQDPGNFTTYAGPVYVSAPHHCIDWGGSISNEGFTEFNSHCS